MARQLRSPWPYDMVIGGEGYLTGAKSPKASPSMTATKPPDLAAQAPENLGYDAQNPTIARTHSYDDLSGGFGQRIQLLDHDKRYHYALGVDCSMGTPWLLGPFLNQQTFNTKGSYLPITDYFEIAGVLFACNGHWILKRNDDTATGWEGVLDLGTGVVAHAKTIYNAGNGKNTAYLCLGSSDFMWTFDGTSGTKLAIYAQDLVLTGLEVWRGILPNELEKADVDADLSDPTNWTDNGGVTYTVGDKAQNINHLATTINGTVLALKTDGMYSLNPDGDSENLYPHLGFAPNSLNGSHGDWLNDLYIGYGTSVYRITPQPVLGSTNMHLPLTQIGPERVADNASEVHGRMTAMAGHDSFCLYGALYNEDTGNGYLLKFGSWSETPDGQPQRTEVWHGSIVGQIVGKYVTSMYVTAIGAAANHKRLYLGYSDGTQAWLALPCTANPANCTAYVFQTDPGMVYLPWFHGGYRNDTKVLRSASVSGMNLSFTDYANVQIAASPTSGYGYLVDSEENPFAFNSTPLQTVGIGANTLAFRGGALASLEKYTLAALEAFTLAELETLEGARLDYNGRYLAMAVTLKSSDGGSPQVMGASFQYQVRLPRNLVRQYYILADRGLIKRDGSVYRRTANDILSDMATFADAITPVAVVLPNEKATNHAVIGWQETTVWSERLRGWFGGVLLQAVEVPTPESSSTPTFGTLLRLEKYTLAELEAFTLYQMEAL